jgi:hypothetical protein
MGHQPVSSGCDTCRDSPGTWISVTGVAPFDIVGGPWTSDGYFGFWFFKGIGGRGLQRSPGSGYLACICSSILGGLLGKRKVERTGLSSTFPPFYRTYLTEERKYN